MENSLWKVLAFIILVLMLFIGPLYYTFIRQDMMTYQIVNTETERFADTVRDLGYITPNMYLDFKERIQATGLNYKVTLSHYKKDVVKVLEGEGYLVDFDSYLEEDILEILFPESSEDNLSLERYYYMSLGDFFIIEVENTGRTKANVMRDMLTFSRSSAPEIYIRAGGMVYNEYN